MVVSAKTASALETAAENLAAFLEKNPLVDLADVAHTLQRGRRRFAHRLAFTCTSVTDAVSALRASPHVYNDHQAERGPVFLFSGQGSQYPGMGEELYRNEIVFREQVDLCASVLEPELGLDIRDLLFPAGEASEGASHNLKQTALAQPALFTIEYALAQLWLSWGVKPRVMIGHSLGEYVAACLAKVFSLEDALKLVAARSRLMQQMPPGGMLAVPMAEAALLERLRKEGHGLELAAVNGLELCVVSGPQPGIEALQTQLTREGLAPRQLHTSHAFHSAMMEPILAPFTALLQRIELSAPQIPYLSNLTGQWIRETQATSPEYWADHLRHTVRFSAGLDVVFEAEHSPVFLELGPGRTLSSLAALHGTARGRPVCVASLPQAQENRGAQGFMLRSVAELWLAGVGIDWAGFYQHERRLRVPLPTYPFERRRYWIEPGKRATVADFELAAGSRHADPADWFYLPAWKTSPAPAPQLQAESAPPCVLFADEHGLADALAAALKQRGGIVLMVRVGAGFGALPDSAYRVNPGSPADFETLLDALHANGALPGQIVYLWSIGPGEHSGESEAGAALSAHCDPLLNLIQALGRIERRSPIELSLICNAMQALGADAPVDPARAALLGLLRTLSLEDPSLACRAIDVSLSANARQRERLVAQLARELSGPAQDPLVVLRAGQRWVPGLEPVRLERSEEACSSVLREGGVYVITGGLDGIGLIFARELATMVRAKLVLTGAGARHPAGDPGAEAHVHQGLPALEALGSEVLPIQLAHHNADELRAVFDQAQARFGRIDGVIHAADMSTPRRFSLMQDQSKAERDAYWQAQQQTLSALDTSLQNRNIDFCLLMSSLAAKIGGIGQAAHAAACVYLEAFAHQHNRSGAAPWIVVHWDMWQEEGERTSTSLAVSEFAITPAEGADAFQRLMALDEASSVIVATGDPRYRQKVLNRLREGQLGAAGPAGAGKLYQRPNLSNAYEPPRNEHEAAVAESWQECLGIGKIGIHDNFFDLGGHSLLAAQLATRLQQTFKVAVDLALFFSAPTIAELSEALLQKQVEQGNEHQLAQQLDKLEQMSEEEAQALLESGSLPEELLKALGN